MSNDPNHYPSPAETAAVWGQQTQEVPAPDGYASPGQPPWAGQFHYPAEVKPRKKRRWPWVLLVLGLLFLLCAGVGTAMIGNGPAKSGVSTEPEGEGAGAAAAKTVAPSVKPSPAAPVYKLGMPIRGGDFLFTLNSKKCGISSVGSAYLNKKPQGSYCRLDLTVKNVTSKPHIFMAQGSMVVTDTQDREFAVDGEAGAYGNKNAMTFLDQINPGNVVRGYVYFDVSGGVKLRSVTFEAGLFTTAQDVVVPLS
jgi:uncharacterized protein DUF4352